MRSSKRVPGLVVAVAAIAGLMVLPGTAQAQSCVPVPVTTTGVTIEGGGEEIRVPAVSGVAVCYDLPGTPGIPWVETEPGGGVSVVITGSSGGEGYVSLRYTTDGAPNELRVPLLGTDGSAETCLVGVGFPARSDCAFKISPDNDPVPTLPPVTPPPTPTVEPEPLPTIPPINEICAQRICVEDVPVIIERLIETVMTRVEEILRDLVIINCGPVFQILGLC